MQTKVKRRILIIVLIIATATAIGIMIHENRDLYYDWFFNKNLKISQVKNNSSGEYWEYTLSNNDVLREVKHGYKRFFLNFGPAEDEVWEFEPIGEGEVTFYWTEYVGGGSKKSEYSATFYVDKDGSCTLVEDSRHTSYT